METLSKAGACGFTDDGIPLLEESLVTEAMTEIAKLKKWIEESNNIVFFGGAGVSTESGIPDFRSVDGLYNQKYDYPPETILSHTFFSYKPEEFYRFYKDKMIALDAKPNTTHLKLAELEAKGKLKAVITQNIDGLHRLAGSNNVLEIFSSNASISASRLSSETKVFSIVSRRTKTH